MKNKLHYITDDMAVLSASIADLGIYTQDTDNNGYLVSNGTNRGLCYGLSPDNEIIIYITTGGDDDYISDDIGPAVRSCHSLGDSGETDVDAVRQGAARLLEAVRILRDLYRGNDTALGQLDWYADKAREVSALSDNDITDMLSED